MLSSVVDLRCDQICCGWNGDNPETLAILEEFGCEIHRWKWNDNFSDARNHIHSKCTSDFIMYLDSDEELSDYGPLRSFLDSGQDFKRCWMWLDYFGDSLVYWKARVVKRGLYFHLGALHEELLPLPDADLSPPDVFLQESKVIHNHKVTRNRGERNCRVTGKEYRERPTPKTAYDFGLCLFEVGRYDEARPLLRIVLESDLDNCYKFQALRMFCQICNDRNDSGRLEQFAQMMIDAAPDKPDGYFKLAEAYSLKHDWQKVVEASVEGFSRDFIPDGLPVDYSEFSIRPARYFAAALSNVGRREAAMQVIEKTLATYPDDEWLLNTKTQLLEV
jgi:glycosyltransferase involved in cell wall biosynthesis